MDWVLTAIGSVGVVTTISGYFLWRWVSGLQVKAQRADEWRLMYEESERQRQKIRQESEIYQAPRGGPDDILRRLQHPDDA